MVILSSGCVTMAKNIINPSVTETPVQVENITVIEEPMPVIDENSSIKEPVEMFIYRTNGHYLNETFGWKRENVSGEKDMEVYTVVYDYKILHGYEWWSDSWGRYFYQIPDSGKKFLFVFVNTWMEGADPTKDPRMWGPNWSHYSIQYNDQIIAPDEAYAPTSRIKEFEEKADYRDVVRVGPYGYLQVQERGNGHRSAVPLQWLRMGTSNAWDGFIPYQIPIEAEPEDLIILGDMYAFGTPYWLLQERPVS